MGKSVTDEKIVHEVKDIQNLLGIGRNTAYEFIRQSYKEKGPFRIMDHEIQTKILIVFR